MNPAFTLGALVVLWGASVAAQDYAIKMQPPLKVGQRYKFTAVASSSSTMAITAEQRLLKNQKEELTVEMESVATVLAIDAKGRPTKESHSIVKLLQGAAKEPMLAAGTTVLASRRDLKEEFLVESKPATGALAKTLELTLEITAGGPTDDEIFGTTERKQVGDRWSVNEALALQDANEKIATAGLCVTSLKGTTTLQKVTKDEGADVLHLVSSMTATASATSKGPFTSADSTLTASLSGVFPTAATKSVRQESSVLAMTLKASGRPNPEGPVVHMSGNMKRSLTRQYKLLD